MGNLLNLHTVKEFYKSKAVLQTDLRATLTPLLAQEDHHTTQIIFQDLPQDIGEALHRALLTSQDSFSTSGSFVVNAAVARQEFLETKEGQQCQASKVKAWENYFSRKQPLLENTAGSLSATLLHFYEQGKLYCARKLDDCMDQGYENYMRSKLYASFAPGQ